MAYYNSLIIDTVAGSQLANIDSSVTEFVPQSDLLLSSNTQNSTIDLFKVSKQESKKVNEIGSFPNANFIKFSPERALFVTCGRSVAFWIPKKESN